ncbi:MAG: glycosyltransferase family 4 protein [Chitinophagales bacterium]
MKILFVLEHFYPYIGGAEKLFYVLTTALAKNGYKVVVVTTRFEKELSKEEVHKGVHIIRLNCWNRYAFTLFSLPKILQHAQDAHLIHTTTYNAALPAIIAGKIRQKPVFVTFHEVWGELWKRLPFTSFLQKYSYYFFEKLLLHLPFYRYIAVSDFTAKALQQNGISSDKIVRIYNGLEYNAFHFSPTASTATFTYTYFGRLGISKGLDLLIPAAAEFRKLFPNTTLKLILPKKPKAFFDKIMRLVKEYELEDYIDFKHNLLKEDLYQELLQSSCVVISSYSEGFCFAAAEAVALEVPIVSSHQGALPEVVSGKFVVMEKMTITALVAALEEAYHENWQHKPIRYFPLKETVEAYQNLYKLSFNNSIHTFF